MNYELQKYLSTYIIYEFDMYILCKLQNIVNWHK